jgi:hypothetical protein
MNNTITLLRIISGIFLIGLITPIAVFSQNDTSQKTAEITEVFTELSTEDQQKILDYAKYLVLVSKENPEEKQERLYDADDIIPTEETSGKIMEFSRYMMLSQKTPEEKITEANQPLAAIKFDNNTFDFGKAKEGDVLEHIFEFTNTGTETLYIHEITVSCGCTIPEWDKIPIPPKGTGKLKIIFDTKTKSGQQVKLVKVLSNTDPKATSLFVKGFVAK